MQSEVFKVDASGQLVVDEAARLSIERLHALNTADELAIKVEELLRTMPHPAAQQLTNLIERYQNYDAALTLLFPPGEVPTSEQAALLMLAGMHALRVQYFGQEVAAAFFAAEEQQQRALIELTFSQRT